MVNTRPNAARSLDSMPVEDPNRDTLRSWRRYLLAGGRSPRTVDGYVWRMLNLAEDVPNLLDATEDDLIEYLARRRRTMAAETRKSIRTAFRSFYRWATRQGLVQLDPAAELPPIYVPEKPARRAPDADLQDALRLATLPEKAMILLGRSACLRLSEIATLHTSMREGDILRIVGKGDKTRHVPIGDELLAVLRRLEHDVGDGYYFPNTSGGHLHVQSVLKIIRRRTGWNTHALRHAGATAAYRATGDIRAVQVLLGHTNIATTQRYVQVDEEAVRRAAIAGQLDFHDRTGPIERTHLTAVPRASADSTALAEGAA